MITNKKFALVFRLVSLIIAISGIVLTCITPEGNFSVGSIVYYTIQSNLLAVILFSLLLYKTVKSLKSDEDGVGFFPRFEMICSVDLLLTLIVYWVLLAPSAFAMGSEFSLFTYDNLAVHLITPLLCLIDYILFTKSNHLKYSDVYAVTIYPLFYVISSSIMGLLGYVYRIDITDGLPVRFPYFFFDFDRTGWFSFVYIIALIIIFIIISHIYYLADKKITKKVILK